MKLSRLIEHLSPQQPLTRPDLEPADVTSDSRAVVPGGLYVAVRGANIDAHSFIPDAVSAGASVIVCEELPSDPSPEVEWVTVPDSAVALGEIASAWYGHPSEKLTLVGVTGTNGKTTIATLLYEMARRMGEKAGLLSTVINKIGDRAVPSTHTTPDPLSLQRLLREMVDDGCSFCAMEVSSHACAQHRIAGLKFAGGIFTNLTRDHLDYHKTFDNYLAAKKSFFDSLGPEAFALTNADDRNGAVMLQNTRARKGSYSLRARADYVGSVIEDRLSGMLMLIDGTEVETRFVGRFNASNLLAVYGAGRLIGWEKDEVLRVLSALEPVAGRMQTFTNGTVTAIVDYAHTPDALDNVLSTITEVVEDDSRIITVCGCGGDRDKGKRPLMAATAAAYSSVVVLTSDNPRTEDPDEILRQMLEGIPAGERGKTLVIPDRAEAIARAVDMARKGDVVLVAGKGHEDYQITGTVKHHFDDREQVCRRLGIGPKQ